MTTGGPARYREEEDNAQGPGHSATRFRTRAPNGMGKMAEKISAETHYVGTMMALIAVKALAGNLASYLAGTPLVDGRPSEEGTECALRQLDAMMNSYLDTAVTDLPPGSYDAEQARRIAWDTLVETDAWIRGRIL